MLELTLALLDGRMIWGEEMRTGDSGPVSDRHRHLVAAMGQISSLHLNFPDL